MTLPRIDLRKVHRELYTATPAPTLVTVPRLGFLAIDGTGDPDGSAYRESVEALYGVSYALRFALKRAGVVDYSVPPLQGLWWGAEEHGPLPADRAAWNWTMMIMQPSQVTPDLVADALAATAAKKPSAALERIRQRDRAEGTAAQILHVGPYATETATIARLLDFVRERGHRVSGPHHEIYLSSPARTAQERLKTIIRYPVTAT